MSPEMIDRLNQYQIREQFVDYTLILVSYDKNSER
jgi:hypothetical protein